MEVTTVVPSVASSSDIDVDTTDYWACTLYYFSFGTVFAGLIIVTGLLGNGLTIRIMGADRHKSSTIYSLFHLAIADSVVLVTYCFVVPPIGFKKLIWGNGVRLSDNYDLVSILYVVVVSQIFNQISAFIIMVVTWQRYISVCVPHKAKQWCTSRTVNILTAASYVIAICFNFPNFFFYVIRVLPGGHYRPFSSALLTNQPFQIIHSVILSSLLNYFIPIFSLSYMSFKILNTLRNSSKLVAQSSSNNRGGKVMKDLTVSSIGVVVLFIICQSFHPARRILMWVYDPYQYATHCGGVLQFCSFFPRVFTMVNSAANFIIYILFAKGFRNRASALLCRKTNVVTPIQQACLNDTTSTHM